MGRGDFYNSEGYPDPTSHDAIANIDRERKAAQKRHSKLLSLIFGMVELAGFEVVGRISLRDKVTGRVWS